MHTHKLNAHAAATSCAIVTGIAFLICVLAYVFAPGATIALFVLFFHGVEVRKLFGPLTLGGTVGSFVLWVVSGYVMAWVSVALYNHLLGDHSSVAGTQKESSGCCRG